MGTSSAIRASVQQGQRDLLDQLGLLLRMEAIFRSTSERIREQAATLAAVVRSVSGRRTLSVSLREEGLWVEGERHEPVGPRQEVARRLGQLNVGRIHFAPTAEPGDLVSFAAVVNREVARVNQAQTVTASWKGLPASVVVEETTFVAGFSEDDARFALTPELDALRDLLSPEHLEGFLEQLGDIRDNLDDGSAAGVTRRVDVLETVLDRLSAVDKESPERAEALVEEALVRFRCLLGHLQERDVSPAFRSMVHEVAERFFPRVARDGRESSLDAGGRRWRGDALPGSARALAALRGRLEAFLAEAPPPLDTSAPFLDASYLHLVSRFLRGDRPAEEVRAVSDHLAVLLDQGALTGLESRLRRFVFSRLSGFTGQAPLNALLYRLVGPVEVAGMLERFNLNEPEQVARFAQMARFALPQAIAGLFRYLEDEEIEFQASVVRRVLRAVGRDAILEAGADLRDSPLFADSAFWSRLRRFRIPEVLPIVEVLCDATDAAMRRAGFLAARAFPFRCRAAFWLRAATRAHEVPPDYLHAVLGLEWAGADDDALFARLLARAQEDAVDHPDRAAFAVRALAAANTDAAAGTLIEIHDARHWGIRPVHPPATREAARRALGEMTCKTAIEWSR